MIIKTLAIWNSSGDVRRIDLQPGFNIITGESQTGKSALIEIIRYCLGSTELRIPAGPIAATASYFGLVVELGDVTAFLGRPALTPGQQTSTAAQLEIGLADLPAADQLGPNTNTDALRDWLGRAVGIEENRFDPPTSATRPPLVARFAHALIHCFQRQDEIASRQLLFHGQADPFVAQAIRDTLPYFLGVTGPDQLRRAAQLRDVRKALVAATRARAEAETYLTEGIGEAATLLSQAADAGLISLPDQPTTLGPALDLLAEVRDAPVPASPKQPAGEEFDRLQDVRADLSERLRAVRAQRSLAGAIMQSGQAAEGESVEQVVRLQPIGILAHPEDPEACPICDQPLKTPPPEVEQLRTSLADLEEQIDAVERDRPALVAIDDGLHQQEEDIHRALQDNRAALDRLADTEQAVADHQQRLDLGTWVKGRIDHYLEKASQATEEGISELRAAEKQLQEKVAGLEQELDPDRLRDAATSVLIGVGKRMTTMAEALGLEHADAGVRIDLGRLTVVADTTQHGPIYMTTGIGSAKNWVGYHLASTLSLQEHFITNNRPVPAFLVLDQPTQAFFPSERADEQVSDQDRADALAQFELVNRTVSDLDGQLQVLVLDHANFDEPWFQSAIVEQWRDGTALIPAEWQ